MAYPGQDDAPTVGVPSEELAYEGADSDGEVDTSLWTGLAFNPMAAFIGGESDGQDNVSDVSSPADVGENFLPGDQTDTPTVDDENEVAETVGQAGDVAEDAVDAAAPPNFFRDIKRLVVVALLGIAGILGASTFVKAFISAEGEKAA